MDQPNRVSGLVPLGRMLLLVLAMVAFVIIPFIIVGEQLDTNLPKLIEGRTTKWAVALTGIALLVLDLFLPVPSSIVSISLCVLLGPIWGAPVVFVGMVGAFVVGYLAGRLLPAARLRAWVGMQTWDSFANHWQTSCLFWIAAARPVPVLAEVTAVFAGSLRLPFWPSLVAAGGSSLFVAIAYGVAAWLSLDQAGSSTTLLVFFAACLPAASWATLKLIQRARAGTR